VCLILQILYDVSWKNYKKKKQFGVLSCSKQKVYVLLDVYVFGGGGGEMLRESVETKFEKELRNDCLRITRSLATTSQRGKRLVVVAVAVI